MSDVLPLQCEKRDSYNANVPIAVISLIEKNSKIHSGKMSNKIENRDGNTESICNAQMYSLAMHTNG